VRCRRQIVRARYAAWARLFLSLCDVVLDDGGTVPLEASGSD
jgi:hypothetical protein